MCIVYALQQSTTAAYTPFATSAYKKHTLVATIGVISAVVAAITQPIMGKISDLASRPAALCAAVTLFTVGYIIVASSSRVSDVVVGLSLNQFGQLGIRQMAILLVADITVLEWRGVGQALTSVPWVLSAFISGYISQGINAYSEGGWRWGYGMFCAIVPVCIAPTILFLFWAQRRARPQIERESACSGNPDAQWPYSDREGPSTRPSCSGSRLLSSRSTSWACSSSARRLHASWPPEPSAPLPRAALRIVSHHTPSHTDVSLTHRPLRRRRGPLLRLWHLGVLLCQAWPHAPPLDEPHLCK